MNDSSSKPQDEQIENQYTEPAENTQNQQISVWNMISRAKTLVPENEQSFALSGDFSSSDEWADAFFSETRENVKPLELPSSSSTTEQVRLNRLANRIAVYRNELLSMHREILDPKPKRTYTVTSHISAGVRDVDVMNKKTYVYLIQSETAKTKIGISFDPRTRKTSLATPERLSLEFVLPCDNRMDALVTEDSLHMMFSEYRKRNEWFNIAAKEIVERCGMPFVAFKGVLP